MGSKQDREPGDRQRVGADDENGAADAGDMGSKQDREPGDGQGVEDVRAGGDTNADTDDMDKQQDRGPDDRRGPDDDDDDDEDADGADARAKDADEDLKFDGHAVYEQPSKDDRGSHVLSTALSS